MVAFHSTNLSISDLVIFNLNIIFVLHLRWDVNHSAEVNENINLGYGQDQGYS